MAKTDMMWTIFGLLAIIYLANIGAGIIEFIPDNAPLIGNIDEAIATVIAIKAFGKNIIR